MSEEIRLSRQFIEQEVPLAKPVDVAVYLMMLAVGQNFKQVAEKLNIKESDEALLNPLRRPVKSG